MKSPVGKLVEIEWLDPRCMEGWQYASAKLLDLPPQTCLTWGVCLASDERFVIVASSQALTDEHTSEGLYGSVMSVPTLLVRRITVIKKR